MAITQSPVSNFLVVTTNVATQDVSVTLGTGTKRSIVVFATRESSPNVTSVVFDPTGLGGSFIQRLDAIHGTVTTLSVRGFVYEVPDGVAAGTYTVRVTYSSATVASGSTIYPWVLDNAARGVPQLTLGTFGVASDPSLTVSGTTTVGAYVMAVAMNASAAASWTWTAPLTEVAEPGATETVNSTAAAVTVATGTSITVTAADGGTSNKVLAVIAIAEDLTVGGASIAPVSQFYHLQGMR